MRFRYKPEDVDCRFCTEYAGSCTSRHCIGLAERMEAGTVGYSEALSETFRTLPLLQYRLQLLGRYFPGTLWLNKAHKERMDLLRRYIGWRKKRDTNAFLAAMYLMTANEDIYQRTCRCFTRNGLFLDRADKRGISIENYTLLGAAKTIYLGTSDLTAEDMADDEIVNAENFRLIVNACIINRFGADALNIKDIK